MQGIEDLAQCDIGEVKIDHDQRLVFLRIYNVTIAFEYEEWNDVLGMLKDLAPMEEGGPEMVAANYRCPSCGFESRASVPRGYIPPCPKCNAGMEPMIDEELH